MANFQGRVAETNLYLTLGGVPATGILFSAAVVKFRRYGEVALTTKTLTALNWIEVGNGFYIIKWDATEVSVIGNFFFTASGVGFDNFVYGEFDVDPVPLPLMTQPGTCIISGNVVDIGGSPARLEGVLARPAGFPMAAGTSVVVADAVKTSPDSFGNFQLVLIRNKLVVIQLERTGVRVTITVPDQPTANLLDLLPPLPN